MARSLETDIDTQTGEVKFIYRYWDGIDTPDRTTIERMNPDQIDYFANSLKILADEGRLILETKAKADAKVLKAEKKRLESELATVNKKLGILNDKR